MSDVWVAKDLAVEAVKRSLRADRKWVQLRTLGKWWTTYTGLGVEGLVKALEGLKGERVLNCKTEGRQWKLGARAREVTLVEEAYEKGGEGRGEKAKEEEVAHG
jgi:hypothetical protein